MNRFLRDNGFGVSLIIGVVLLVIGILSQPILLVPAVIFVLFGVVAQPMEEFMLSRTSLRLKWLQATAEAVQRRLGDSVPEVSENVDATVIRDSGNVVVTPGTARLRLRAFPPTVRITRDQSPDEFAETLVEQIIKPAFIPSEEPVGAPTIENDEPEPHA